MAGRRGVLSLGGGNDYEAELSAITHANVAKCTADTRRTRSRRTAYAEPGVRWDSQIVARRDRRSANPFVPARAARHGAAADNVIKWNHVRARVARRSRWTMRRTLVRASYSHPRRRSIGAATCSSTVQYSYIYFYGVDKNGDRQVQTSELQGNLTTGAGNAGYVGFSITNPTQLSTPNKIGSYKTPMTDEAIVGLDHQFSRDIAVSASYTWRRYSDFIWNPLTGVDGNDYTVAGSTSATSSLVGPYSVNYYKINPAAIPGDNGHTYQTRPDYHQIYKGLEIAATKRMSNHWMARWVGRPAPPRVNRQPAACRIRRRRRRVGYRCGWSCANHGSGKADLHGAAEVSVHLQRAYQAKWGITTASIACSVRVRPFFRSAWRRATLSSSKRVRVGRHRLLPPRRAFARRAHRLAGTEGEPPTLNFDIGAFNLLNGHVPRQQCDTVSRQLARCSRS